MKKIVKVFMVCAVLLLAAVGGQTVAEAKNSDIRMPETIKIYEYTYASLIYADVGYRYAGNQKFITDLSFDSAKVSSGKCVELWRFKKGNSDVVIKAKQPGDCTLKVKARYKKGEKTVTKDFNIKIKVLKYKMKGSKGKNKSDAAALEKLMKDLSKAESKAFLGSTKPRDMNDKSILKWNKKGRLVWLNICQISTKDLKMDLSKLTALETVIVQTNIKQIKVGKNKNLQTLDVTTSSITSIDVSGCPNLKTLELWGNKKLKKLDITKNKKLKRLNLLDTPLKTLKFSPGMELDSLVETSKESKIKWPATKESWFFKEEEG